MDMEQNIRKHPRLKEYDYGQNGVYFVTICVRNREPLLSTVSVGRDAHIPPSLTLLRHGVITDKYIRRINAVYPTVSVDNYVIMPNHVHLLIRICDQSGGMRASRPTLHTVVRSLKTMVTKESGQAIWQDSYYDHVVRSERDYQEIWRYIDENPVKWEMDSLFSG